MKHYIFTYRRTGNTKQSSIIRSYINDVLLVLPQTLHIFESHVRFGLWYYLYNTLNISREEKNSSTVLL